MKDTRSEKSRFRLLCLCGFLTACSPAAPTTEQRQQLIESLRYASSEPERAFELCAPLPESLRGDCISALVEAHPKHARAEGWCASAPSGVSRDECMFQLAERRDDLAQCRRAGSFALDCEMHVLTRRLRTLDTTEPIDAYSAAVERLLERDDLEVTEARYWSAAFRHYLEKSPDPDRRRCKTLQAPLRRDACWNTGIAVYNDLLNRLRDRRRIDCTRSEPPDALRRPGDPELGQILDDRWPKDLCTPRH